MNCLGWHVNCRSRRLSHRHSYRVGVDDKSISKIGDFSLHGEGQEDVTSCQVSMNDLWFVVVKVNKTLSGITEDGYLEGEGNVFFLFVTLIEKIFKAHCKLLHD